jgi:hypothetical protein
MPCLFMNIAARNAERQRRPHEADVGARYFRERRFPLLRDALRGMLKAHRARVTARGTAAGGEALPRRPATRKWQEGHNEA